VDYRWKPFSPDSRKDVRVILHPTAPIWAVREGLDPGSDDSVDLSPYVTQGSHSAFEARVTLKFNRELFGETQPKPFQILEIQLWQSNEWKPVWLGIVDSLNSFTLQRGERSVQLTAKTREQQDIWKNTKRITPLFPQMTDLSYIIQRVARSAGMRGDEILLPNTSFTTAHSNTQLADMNAWDMVQSVCTPIGWTPFIDALGRLRVANRELQHRVSDVVLKDALLVKVGGQRQRPPKSRVRVSWLNPTMKMYRRQDQSLGGPQTITMGWFLPYWKHTVWFSADKTQRADHTRINWDTSQSVNIFGHLLHANILNWCKESWTQQAPNHGKLSFVNYDTFAVVGALIISWLAAHKTPDTVHVPSVPITVPTQPTGRTAEAAAGALLMFTMMNVGTGAYDIWGTPYDWVHARNVSEAFDSSVPTYVDNADEIESDFIVNEEHAKAVAIRELIYQARAANKWSVTMVDDPRIEFGDILQFTDGSQLYVEDFTRSIERGSEAILDVSGFLIPLTKTAAFAGFEGSSPPPPTGDGVTPPTGAGDGSDGLQPGEPAFGPGSRNEPLIPMSDDPAQMESAIKASLYYFNRKDFSYWFNAVNHPGQYGDGRWVIGWNAYMEQRMAPGDTGAALHSLIEQPSVHTTPPPPGYPPGGWV